jgi:hypothetical protein
MVNLNKIVAWFFSSLGAVLLAASVVIVPADAFAHLPETAPVTATPPCPGNKECWDVYNCDYVACYCPKMNCQNGGMTGKCQCGGF